MHAKSRAWLVCANACNRTQLQAHISIHARARVGARVCMCLHARPCMWKGVNDHVQAIIWRAKHLASCGTPAQVRAAAKDPHAMPMHARMHGNPLITRNPSHQCASTSYYIDH